KGPITKSEIEEIRSSGADHIIPILLEKKLIYVSGKKKALGNPNLYEVTQDFYAYLGIKDKEELLEFD
ncbi:SMC-Scp complex subunit ScpB, partial [Streptobacillus moniliformis]